MTRPLQQNATRTGYWRLWIESAEIWRVADCVERRSQFLEEQIRRRVAIPAPPAVDFENLYVSFRCGSDREGHRLRRSSSRIADAGRRRPDSADFQDAERASCSARRSSSVRSSPSSSATRSTTVPSGKVVGSSRTSRPFSTRARRGLMSFTVRVSEMASKGSGCTPKPVDLLKPRSDLVPTGWY
jgi:hypothetical protein